MFTGSGLSFASGWETGAATSGSEIGVTVSGWETGVVTSGWESHQIQELMPAVHYLQQ